MVTCGVAERTQEFGIRLALGASRRNIARDALHPVFTACAFGLVAGLGVYAASTRWLTSLMFDVTVFDPLTIVACTLLLVGAVAAATWLPVRRAARTDPAIALRLD